MNRAFLLTSHFSNAHQCRPFWCPCDTLRGCRFKQILTSLASTTLPASRKLSKYSDNLLSDTKSRYLAKLELIGGVDPLQLERPLLQNTMFPSVDSSDIVSYLVLQTSFITAKQFRVCKCKSLEVYNQSRIGWVKDVRAHVVGARSVVETLVVIMW